MRRLGIAIAMCAGPIVVVGAAIALASKFGIHLRFLRVLYPVIVVTAYCYYVRRIEHRTPEELALKGAFREFMAGSLLGAGLFCAVVAILATVGAFYIVDGGSFSGMAIALTSAIATGLVEEIVFRGIVYRLTEATYGSNIAIVASAVLFGAAHAFSPNATLVATAAIAIEAGILLALAYVVTRRLWFAIGFHAAWNFTQGGIFSLAVSGHRSDGLLAGQTVGPEWLTGGAFGPEASLIAVVVCLAASAVLYMRARRQSLLVPRPVTSSPLNA